jgi:hypothetical protein
VKESTEVNLLDLLNILNAAVAEMDVLWAHDPEEYILFISCVGEAIEDVLRKYDLPSFYNYMRSQPDKLFMQCWNEYVIEHFPPKS